MKALTAKDVMNPSVLTVSEEMTLRQLAEILTDRQISGAPVLNEEGKLVGVVSLTDIALHASEQGTLSPDRSDSSYDVRSWDEQLDPRELHGFHIEDEGPVVRQVMTPAVYTVPEETPVSDLARTMISGRLHRLLVTRGDRVVGIVTSLDLLRVLIEPAGDART